MSRRAYWYYTRQQPPIHATMLSPELLAQNPKCTFSMTCFRPWCVYVCVLCACFGVFGSDNSLDSIASFMASEDERSR
jgi:hypothetical protein